MDVKGSSSSRVPVPKFEVELEEGFGVYGKLHEGALNYLGPCMGL